MNEYENLKFQIELILGAQKGALSISKEALAKAGTPSIERTCEGKIEILEQIIKKLENVLAQY